MKIKIIIFFLSILITSMSSAENKKHKIVFLGDSLTEGYGVTPDQSFPKLIEIELKKKYNNISIINAGSSGSTSASAPTRIKWLIKSNPTILFIALGANDGLRGLKLDQTEKNLQQAITLALDKNIKVILAGVRIPVNYGKKYRADFENLYKKLAKKNTVSFIPYILKDVAGVKKLNQADGIHPNKEGHKVISKNIRPYIEKLL